jgi:acyl-CoA synthetase (AMP-forming)/AMP-acid ligase II
MAETTLAVTGVRPGHGARIVRPSGPLDAGTPVTVVGSGTLGVDRPEDPAGWIASCGTPVPGTTVDVVDDDGAVLPDGRFGEIRVAGTSVADGYESPDPTASEVFGADGLRTGDAGFLLDGELYVVGRIGDSIKVRGRKVHAEDLEAALGSLPGVPPGRCAVALGTRDGSSEAVIVVEASGDGWLEAATGVLRSTLDASVRVTLVRSRRGTIPRTSSGKPRRRLLWQRAGDNTLTGDVLHRTHGDDRSARATTPGLDGAAA